MATGTHQKTRRNTTLTPASNLVASLWGLLANYTTGRRRKERGMSRCDWTCRSLRRRRPGPARGKHPILTAGWDRGQAGGSRRESGGRQEQDEDGEERSRRRLLRARVSERCRSWKREERFEIRPLTRACFGRSRSTTQIHEGNLLQAAAEADIWRQIHPAPLLLLSKCKIHFCAFVYPSLSHVYVG